jgi:hypothetical protein
MLKVLEMVSFAYFVIPAKAGIQFLRWSAFAMPTYVY